MPQTKKEIIEDHLNYIENRQNQEYVINAKKTLDWFLEIIGESEWKKRKKNIVSYFTEAIEYPLLTNIVI